MRILDLFETCHCFHGENRVESSKIPNLNTLAADYLLAAEVDNPVKGDYIEMAIFMKYWQNYLMLSNL